MSVSDEEPYQTIFASLKHPIRRRILRMLSKNPMTFSEMLEALGVSNSFLTYHLENLGELVSKVDDGKYRLSSFGEAAMATMTKVEDIPATAPHQSSETGTKKIVGKNVAIALGIICILLVSGLGGAIAYYTMTINNKNATYDSYVSSHSHSNSDYDSLNSQVGNLQNQNGNLQTWLNGNETLLNQAQTWLDGNETLLNQTQANNTNLQNQNTDLTTEMKFIVNPFLFSILLLNESRVLYNQTISQPADSYTDIPFLAWDAGYFSVNVTSSTTDTTYVEVFYSAHGINYNNTITVGTNGTAVFPFVPKAS
ncbi:MAG: winged helix-turn-helix domain-containing protein [Candidatus Bathyarchaeia archaeon]